MATVSVLTHGPLVNVYNKVLLPTKLDTGEKLPPAETMDPGVDADQIPPVGVTVMFCAA